MDAYPQWEQHGLLLGQLTANEMETYGRWTVGTNVPADHPGYTERLYVKSPWIARPPKYLKGQYPFKHRKYTGEWEYVRVLDGRLDLLIQDTEGEIRRFPLEAGEDVDVPPDLLRAWEFPENREFAMGTAVCRRLSALPIRPGAGAGYEFRLWDSKTSERLLGPLTLPSWRIQYVDVLGQEGYLVCYADALSHGGTILRYGDHVFARPGVATWLPGDSSSFGVVLYLQ